MATLNPGQRSQLKAFLLGGLLPVLAFTAIEELFGTVWGLIAGMAFGVGEIVWEWRSQRRVEAMTWAGNGLILVLGGLSLVTQEGMWFKLQPALIEAAMGLMFCGGVLIPSPPEKPPLLLVLARNPQAWEQMRPDLRPQIRRSFQGMAFRIGVFFLIHAGLATWAALHWSTAAWAFLKGVGFTLSFILYVVVESVFFRYTISSISKTKVT